MHLADDGTLMTYDAVTDDFRPATLRDVVRLEKTIHALVRRYAPNLRDPILTLDEIIERDATVDPTGELALIVLTQKD